MPLLSLSFLGGFQAKLDDQIIPHFRSSNAQGLLVFLALQAERPFPREVLASLFWPDSNDATAKKNLRQALYQLRQLLQENDDQPQPTFLVTRQTIQFNADSAFELDVQSFLQALESGDLATAVSLYHGELLAGFTCDSLEFEAWLRQEREHLHRRALQAMSDLAERQLAQGQLSEVQVTARRQLALEPWQEAAHRQLMQALALNGDRSGALAQFELCRAVLDDELGVEPSAKTVALAEQIGANQLRPPNPDLIAGRYALGEQIGQGAMGVVYRGQDAQTGQAVAIKMLDRSRVEGKPELVERFRREGEALRQLNHPNIVKMLAVDEKDGRHYLVMEYIQGGDLQQLLQEAAPLPLDRALTIALDLADALTRAHRLQILHRDLKPANVLLAKDGIPRLSDFGIARLGNTSDLTQTGAVMGTIAYLSPEACMGGSLDERADIWAFGVLLFEMLAGKRPFDGQTPGATLYAILNNHEPDISLLRPDIPDSLRELLHSMLTKNREERIPSVRLVGAALEALLTGTDLPLLIDTQLPAASNQVTEPPATLPSPAPKPIPYQAAAAPPHFVGRETAVTELAALLTHTPAIVALVGMGGTGKTALAAALAAQLKDQFADGVLWANVMNSEPDHILELWGRAYDHDFSGLADVKSRATAVRSLLADKQTLLVIDNVDKAAAARPLLLGGEQCAVLITTRNLEIAAALNAQPYSLAELSSASSRQLLIQILGQERVLATGEELSAADEISRVLHHLPLAVEIAAQRLKSRPRMRLAQMAERLQSTQRRLGLAISDSAVRSSFQVSWENLDWNLQQSFASLAVFGGRPFATEAAAAVADKDAFDAEDDLYSLAALSLVQDIEETRYRQHPLLADFAAEQLQDEEGVYGRFAAYYLKYAQESSGDFTALDPEWENIAAAINVAHDLAQWQTVLDYADALADDWLRYGRYTDAEDNLTLAQAAAQNLKSDEALAQTQLRLAEINIEQSSYTEAIERLEAAIQLSRQLEDQAKIAKILYLQGIIQFNQSDFETAEQSLSKSQQLYKDLENEQGKANTFFLLGWIYYETDAEMDRAENMAQTALAMQASIDSPADSIQILRLLANIEIRKENVIEAKNYIQRALDLSKQHNISAEIGPVQYQLIMIHILEEEYEVAEEMGEETLALFRRLGDRRHEAMTLHLMSYCYLKMNQLGLAESISMQTLDMYREIEDQLGYAYALRNLGDIKSSQGLLNESIDFWEEANQIAQRLNHQHLLGQLQSRLASDND